MNTIAKIDHYAARIAAINYQHREGGKYAYVQFLSLTREVLLLLKPLPGVERERATIEGINRLFNQYLCDTFGEQQRIVFELRQRELGVILARLSRELGSQHEAREQELFLKRTG